MGWGLLPRGPRRTDLESEVASGWCGTYRGRYKGTYLSVLAKMRMTVPADPGHHPSPRQAPSPSARPSTLANATGACLFLPPGGMLNAPLKQRERPAQQHDGGLDLAPARCRRLMLHDMGHAERTSSRPVIGAAIDSSTPEGWRGRLLLVRRWSGPGLDGLKGGDVVGSRGAFQVEETSGRSDALTNRWVGLPQCQTTRGEKGSVMFLLFLLPGLGERDGGISRVPEHVACPGASAR